MCWAASGSELDLASARCTYSVYPAHCGASESVKSDAGDRRFLACDLASSRYALGQWSALGARVAARASPSGQDR